MRLRSLTEPHEPLYPGTGFHDARWSFVVDLDEDYLEALHHIRSQTWSGEIDVLPMIMPQHPQPRSCGSGVVVMVIWVREDRDAALLRLML